MIVLSIHILVYLCLQWRVQCQVQCYTKDLTPTEVKLLVVRSRILYGCQNTRLTIPLVKIGLSSIQIKDK